MYFPSQKLFYFFIPVIIVLGLFLAVRDRFQVKNTQDSIVVVAQSDNAREKIEEKDLNNNGIEDWKEQFSATTSISIDKSIKTPDSSDNLTESISKDLFAQYIELKKSGAYSSAGVEDIAYGITNRLTESSLDKVFTEKDLLINETTDSNTVKTYANSLAKIRDTYFALNRSDQFVFSGFEDESFLNKILQTSKHYGEMTKEISSLPVPRGLVPSHLALLNNYANSEKSLKLFSVIDDDPARSLQGINAYLQLQNQEQVILKNIAEYLRQNGIIFLSSENGSFWNTL